MSKEAVKRDDKLTTWEAGQELIRANDVLCDVIKELKDYPELQDTVKKSRRKIAIAFNKFGSHGFGI